MSGYIYWMTICAVVALVSRAAALRKANKRIRELSESHYALVDGLPGLKALFSAELPPNRNYCEIATTRAANGAEITITVQRKDRKTPHELRKEAETQRDRALALLRDDAHRSRQTRDGSRRYDAWREQRDALIREVEG